MDIKVIKFTIFILVWPLTKIHSMIVQLASWLYTVRHLCVWRRDSAGRVIEYPEETPLLCVRKKVLLHYDSKTSFVTKPRLVCRYFRCLQSEYGGCTWINFICINFLDLRVLWLFCHKLKSRDAIIYLKHSICGFCNSPGFFL